MTATVYKMKTYTSSILDLTLYYNLNQEATMGNKTRFKFFRLLMNIADIAQTAKELYEKVLELSQDPALRSLASKLKTQLDSIKK